MELKIRKQIFQLNMLIIIYTYKLTYCVCVCLSLSLSVCVTLINIGRFVRDYVGIFCPVQNFSRSSCNVIMVYSETHNMNGLKCTTYTE